MTIEELAGWRNAIPFLPFRIFLSDGRTSDVLRSWNIGASRLNTECLVWDNLAWKSITLSEITEIKPIPPTYS